MLLRVNFLIVLHDFEFYCLPTKSCVKKPLVVSKTIFTIPFASSFMPSRFIVPLYSCALSTDSQIFSIVPSLLVPFDYITLVAINHSMVPKINNQSLFVHMLKSVAWNKVMTSCALFQRYHLSWNRPSKLTFTQISHDCHTIFFLNILCRTLILISIIQSMQTTHIQYSVHS